MKYLQVGILVALVAVAVLLGLNLMNDRAAQEPEAIPSAAATPLPESESQETAMPEGTDEAAEPQEAGNASNKPENPAQPRDEKPVATGSAPSRTEARNTPTPSKASSSQRVPVGSTRRPSPSSQVTSASKPSTPDPAPLPQTERVETASNTRPDVRSLPPAPEVPEPTLASSTERYEIMRPESTEAAARNIPPAPPRTVTIPAGTILTIRTVQTLSSRSNSSGDTFSGTLDQPLVFEDLVIAERGSRVEGKVVEVTESGRVKGVAQLVVQLTKINTSDGQTVNVRTQSFTMEAEKTSKSDATKVGIATGIGAALGAIFGGGKGAAIGAAAGAGAGGGTVLATKGKPAEIPSETRINFRLEQPLALTEKINQ